MSRERPSLLLRLAVVVGGFTLLLGLVGVVVLFVQDDGDASAAGPGLGERVRVLGADDGARLVVNARWEDGAILHTEAARPLAHEADVYLLPPGLAGRTVVLEVLDATSSRTLASRDVVIARGQEIPIEIEPAADR